jgi:hypothetical protein
VLRRSEIPFLVGPFDAGVAQALERGEFEFGEEVEPRIAEVVFRVDDKRCVVQKGYYSAADRVLYVPREVGFEPQVEGAEELRWNDPNRLGGWVVVSYLLAASVEGPEGDYIE